jgi:hypothetical protein
MRTAPQEYVFDFNTNKKRRHKPALDAILRASSRAGSSLHIELDPAVHIGAAGKLV